MGGEFAKISNIKLNLAVKMYSSQAKISDTGSVKLKIKYDCDVEYYCDVNKTASTPATCSQCLNV